MEKGRSTASAKALSKPYRKKEMGIVVKSPKEIEIMRQAGRIVAAILDILKKRIEPGIITQELDTMTVHELNRHGAESSFKGYRGFHHSRATEVSLRICVYPLMRNSFMVSRASVCLKMEILFLWM